jgi:hypothetical protein
MPSHFDNFQSWYVEVLESLYDRRNDGGRS